MRVGPYRVLEKIAEGGMAAVYAVRRADGSSDEILAMKLLLSHLKKQARFVEMFVDEARIASQVRHPNVVQVFDVGAHDGTPYIVMEYLGGVSLANALATGATFDRDALLGIFADVADGLHAAHRACGVNGAPLGVVHRDVSPENVMLCFDGRVIVVDFGIAAAQGRLTSTQTGELKGKLAYMAPEQLHHRAPIDARTDIWAWGVMVWQALAGRVLFKGESASNTMWNIVNREVPDLLTIDPDVPDAVVELVEQCLERDPFRRPSSAAECAAVCRSACGLSPAVLNERIATDVGAAFEAERRREQERTKVILSAPAPHAPRSRRRMMVLGFALASGAAVATAIVFAQTPDVEPVAIGPEVVAADTPAPVDDRPAVVESHVNTIELAVPAQARLVLVDGVRHDERPLRVDLEEDHTAEVLMVHRRGETRVRVTSESGSRVLTDAYRATAKKRRRPAPRPAPEGAKDDEPEEDGLLEVPL